MSMRPTQTFSLSHWIKTEDWHTAGEPFRIVADLSPYDPAQGTTVSERRKTIIETPNHPLDILRQSLCHEPRGHADMYGGFLTPADDDKAHFGVLFWHKNGFSTACGHGTIALGYWALAHGVVKGPKNGSVDVVIDVPSGRVVAQMSIQNDKVMSADFINISSYQLKDRFPLPVEFESATKNIHIDLSFGGAVYASVNVADLRKDMHIESKNYEQFVALGRQIKATLGPTAHYGDYDLYGVCFFETLSDNEEAIVQRNVVVFADGQIDRSPCGSGTCARLAVLLAQGKVSKTKKLIHHSIINSTFEAFVVSEEDGPSQFPACITRVKGNAFLTGRHEFYINPEDSIYPGFLLF